MAAAARVLAPGGLFAFTVETQSSDGVVLQQTLRYAHGVTHVRTAIADAGLHLAGLNHAVTRKEKGVPVPSLVVVASGSGPERSALTVKSVP
jgi:predicted TPR repeat methyltransferase